MTAAHLAHVRAFGPARPVKEADTMAPPEITYEEIEDRLSFHPADTDLKRDAHETARRLTIAYAKAMSDFVPGCREKSLFLTAVQEGLMWANAALAINGGPREHIVADDLETIRRDFGAYYGDAMEPAQG